MSNSVTSNGTPCGTFLAPPKILGKRHPKVHRVTVGQVMAWNPCEHYTRERVTKLFAGRRTLGAVEIAALRIPCADRLWALQLLLTCSQRKAVYRRCGFSGLDYDGKASLLLYPLAPFTRGYTRHTDARVLRAIVTYLKGAD